MPTDSRISYRDVKERILANIHDRVWRPGDVLPGEVALAEELGCARATVNRAMRELAEAGILDRRRKAGTSVSLRSVRKASIDIPLIHAEVEGGGAIYRYALVSREVGTPPDWLRARLALPEGTQVVHLECMHYADGQPFQFEDRWINVAAVPDVLSVDFRSIGPNEWLVAKTPFTDAEFSFFAMAASERIAGFLGVAEGAPLLAAERVTWLAGQPVTFARLYAGSGYRVTTRY